jgi:replicative DNA helicase
VPPHSIEAERAVLGAALVEPAALDVALQTLRAEDFYREAHGRVFAAMAGLADRSEAVDIVTVAAALASEGALEAAGGKAALADLAASAGAPSNVASYARVVAEKAALRRLIVAANRILGMAFEEEGARAADVLGRAEQVVFEVADRSRADDPTPLARLLHDSFRRIEEYAERKNAVTGVPSGFEDLDRITGGFQPEDLVVVAGRPSMGKTSFAMNVIEHVACDAGLPVAFFSLEMGPGAIAMRFLTSAARVNHRKIRAGDLDDAEWARLAAAADRLARGKIFVDNTDATTAEMRARCRRLSAEHGLALVVVDYMQLVRPTTPIENRAQEVAEISRGLKGMARELRVPVMALSQLSRAPEQRKSDHRPQLSDLRDSGAIEQDADLVLFIHREEVYNPGADEGIAEAIIRKHRNGELDTIRLAFLKAFTRFENLYEGEPAAAG